MSHKITDLFLNSRYCLYTFPDIEILQAEIMTFNFITNGHSGFLAFHKLKYCREKQDGTAFEE
jgi:hypothetical protein